MKLDLEGREALLVLLSLLTGISIGFMYSGNQKILQGDERAYCIDVEQAIQENMTEGFVNCFTPDRIPVNVTEEVRRSADVRCVCRRKIGQNVVMFNLAESN